jgi:hypothetical protein
MKMYFVALYTIVAACFLLFLFCDHRCNAHAQNAYSAVMPSSGFNNMSASLD